jgi:ubiquinone/menaquinone biosynthesis C-methylase UbiE
MAKRPKAAVFDKQARKYAVKREAALLVDWRSRLLRTAEGRVLELAVGAGVNFPYYPPGVQVTAVDFSTAMLEHARRAAASSNLAVQFVCGDIESLALPEQSFDTVVSTLSLCAYDQPLAVLRQMRRWCRPGGRILLLEHGKSTNPPLALLQKAADPLLYRMLGCHHTRDIGALAQEAGLQVERTERCWLGMGSLIWARP